MARTCGILKLNTAVEAYINAIISITNINDNREIRNAELIENLITFIRINGQYIRTGWTIILETISKIDYYLNTDKEYIDDLKHKPTMKNLEKEISINFQKKDILSKHITDMIYDGIFSKTNYFDEETIINFVTSLCAISKNELTEYYHRRVFSLVKLSEVADFNMSRIQVEWVKIWKLIGDHFVYVITHIIEQNIWQNALDNLKQIIGKLLLKKDFGIYNFQMDFFNPFEIIFRQTKGIPERGQFLIGYIYFIVGQYGISIHSGWIVIFRILKEALRRNDPKINEEIQKTLQKISEESFMINNANIEVFRGYIETLCYMYLDKSLKQYSFETILNLLAKIMQEMDDIDEELLIKYTNEIKNEETRSQAIENLYKYREENKNIAIYLWYSRGTMAALLQEITNIYQYITTSKLTTENSNKAKYIISLFQIIALNPKTRKDFLESQILVFLYPFLSCTNKTKSYEIIRVTSLSVIAALVKIDDSDVINFLIKTEIIPVILRIMEKGTEIIRAVACFIIQRIIDNNLCTFFCFILIITLPP